VRKCNQKSPEAFLRHHWQAFTRASRMHQKRNGRLLSPARMTLHNTVEIDFEHLLSLYKSQCGLCAVSGLPMTHQFNDLCSISVDRVDSKLGYVPGNVQLVCKWVNLAKQRHSNEEFRAVLDLVRSKSGN
jgi:hypothetical protein